VITADHDDGKTYHPLFHKRQEEQSTKYIIHSTQSTSLTHAIVSFNHYSMAVKHC